ncbi:MAG TPA: peroxidase-related enzyme [Acidimicrobiia bacterium]|nr:peroxidase-related enzyme [Acidimicrobiia bacterium]
MPHIPVSEEWPGIVGLFSFKPSTGRTMAALAHQLLRGPSSLTEGERELIAAFVSSRNECYFCTAAHSAAACELVDGGRDVVDAVVDDPGSAPVGEKMQALLHLAGKVQRSGREVTADDIAAARAAGADDEAIHDAVLVAAAFCMFNRYVDGLDAVTPREAATYDFIGKLLAAEGYGALGT